MMSKFWIGFLIGGGIGTIAGFFFSLIAIGIGKGLKDAEDKAKEKINVKEERRA